MRSTPTSDPTLPSHAPSTGWSRRRARHAATAALAALSVVGPGAYVASAIVAAPPAFAKKASKKHKCKKGFVYQHGKCRASSRPVY